MSAVNGMEVIYNDGERVSGAFREVQYYNPAEPTVILTNHSKQTPEELYHTIDFGKATKVSIIFTNGQIKEFT
jgi:ribonucleotide monophosphatase NagD (HAD superfamily)